MPCLLLRAIRLGICCGGWRRGDENLQELAPALSKWDTSHDGAFDHEDDPNIQIRHLPTSAPKYVVRVGSQNYGCAEGEEFHIKGGIGGGKGCCIVQ